MVDVSRFDFVITVPSTVHSSFGFGAAVKLTDISTSEPILTLYSVGESVLIVGLASVTVEKKSFYFIFSMTQDELFFK